MNLILFRAIIKARRNGLLYLVPTTGPVWLDCLADKCAKCCLTLGSPVVTDTEAERINDKVILKSKKGMFIKSKNCTCCLLQDGLCSIYSVRPRGCQEYPWYNIDGQLYYDAGCPGIKYDKDERPRAKDIQPFENFFPSTSPLIIRLIKRVCLKNRRFL